MILDKKTKILKLREQGFTIRQIMKKVGLNSPSSVFHYINKNNVSKQELQNKIYRIAKEVVKKSCCPNCKLKKIANILLIKNNTKKYDKNSKNT